MNIMRKFLGNVVVLALIFFVLYFPYYIFAASLTEVSDTISTSQPLAGADHDIKFTVTTAIPGYGQIKITPQAGKFFIPSTLTHNDMKLFVNNSEWQLGTTTGFNVNGVEIIPGNNGRIVITIAPNLSILSGEKVKILVGRGPNFPQIINPDTVGSYRIDIETFDFSSNPLDRATAMIAIVEPVQVGGEAVEEEPLINTLPGFFLTNPISIVLNGALYNLGWATSVDAYFQFREKGATNWNETPKETKIRPTIFTAVVTGIRDNIVYEFRAAIDWLKWHGVPTPYTTTTYGEILEIPLPPLVTSPSPPPPPPPPSAVSANPPPPPAKKPPPYVAFSGWAFPNGQIVVIKDQNPYATTTSNRAAEFLVEINEPHIGTFNFILQAKDNQGRSSQDLAYSVEATQNRAAIITNILFAPTIAADKPFVSPGGSLKIFGSSVPDANIEIQILSGKEIILSTTTKANPTGNWEFIFNSTGIKTGKYIAYARAKFSEETSIFSKALNFNIGLECKPADLNCDRKVDIIDFSILMFYWNTTDPRADINQDGRVNIIDFSIMMANWGAY